MKVYGELKYMQLEVVNGIGALTGPANSGRMVQDISGSLASPLFYDNTQWRSVLLGPTSGASTIAKNIVYAGPATGANATPTFRSLVSADLGVILGFWAGNFDGGSSWSTSSGSYISPTLSGSTFFTQRVASGLTVTQGASSVPGVTFTPSSTTAAYQVSFKFGLCNSAIAGISGCQLTDGTSVICQYGMVASTVAGVVPTVLEGIYIPGTVSPVTLIVKLAKLSGAGNTILQAASAGGLTNSLEISIVQIRG